MSELGENSRAPSVFVLLHCTSHSATRAAPSRAQIVKVGLPAVQPTWGGKLPTGSQSCLWGNGGWSRPLRNRTCWPAGAGGPAELAGPCSAAASPPTRTRVDPMPSEAGDTVGGVSLGCSLPAAGSPRPRGAIATKEVGPARAPPHARARRTRPRLLTCGRAPRPRPRASLPAGWSRGGSARIESRPHGGP